MQPQPDIRACPEWQGSSLASRLACSLHRSGKGNKCLFQKSCRNFQVIRANHPKMLLLGLCSWCIRMLEPCETYGCGILILKINSSTLCLGSFLTILTLLQNHFFSILLWERKKIWQFPLLLPWHILCARELAQRSWYCPLLGRCCVCTPREKLLGLALLVESHSTVLHQLLPREQAQAPWTLYTLSVSGCCISALCAACCFPGSMWSSAVCSGFYREWVNAIKWSFYATSWQHRKLSHCQGVLFIQQFVPRKQPI